MPSRGDVAFDASDQRRPWIRVVRCWFGEPRHDRWDCHRTAEKWPGVVEVGVNVGIPRRSFGQKFLPFSGRAALPVLGRKSAVCRGNVFVAANIPFQESSETKTTYSRGVEYFCGLHWAFLPGTVTAMRKNNLQRLSFHLHLQTWLPSYHILCVFVFEGFLCGMITKGLKSVQS